MKLNRIISIALSFAVLLSVVCFDVSAAGGDFEFEITDGSAEVTAYNGNAADVDIPETLAGFKVTSIGEDAFRKNGLKSVSMPDTVKTIKKSAFADCASLTTVQFSSSLESIGNTAFYNCEDLSSALRFPEVLKEIGNSAFENCWDMSYAIIPASVEVIGYCALGYYYDSDADKKYYDFKRSDFRILGYNDSEAYTYSLSHKVDFYDLSSGFNAVTSGGMDFFVENSEAELIAYAGTSYTPSIPSKVGGYTVTSIGGYAFFAAGIRDVVIPETVVRIGEWAFGSCESLGSIKIPPSVTSIGDCALGYCYDNGLEVPYDGFIVGGAKDSAAKSYADKYGFKFKDMYTTSVTLPKSSGTIYLKGSLNINADVKNPFGKTTYKSADTDVAKVNSSGKVTGIKAGKTKITVTNNGVKKTFTVTVKKPSLNISAKTIKPNKIYQLKIKGKVGTPKFVSSNKKVLKVNSKNGKFKGLKSGKAVITVKTNGIKLKCKIKVK